MTPDGSVPPRSHRFTGRDGVLLTADVWGEASSPPLLLLHGGGQTRHAWGRTGPRLAALGWRVVAPDLRGHGTSEWSADGAYDLGLFADDVRALVDTLAGPACPPVLVGASLGGLGALLAAGEEPMAAVRALVLVDVAHRPDPRGVRRIVEFMRGRPDGFAGVEEAAEAVSAYLPHRPRPDGPDGTRGPQDPQGSTSPQGARGPQGSPSTKDSQVPQGSTNPQDAKGPQGSQGSPGTQDSQGPQGLRNNLRRRGDRWVWHWDPRLLDSFEGRMDPPDMADRLLEAARRTPALLLLVRGAISDVVRDDIAEEFCAHVPHARRVEVPGAGHMVAGDRNDHFLDAIAPFLPAP
ncbi:alpha/beta fold hydrolase [Streptomyces sp. NPDC017941]|uniref:alpha/beta fold hydrolase n=1 Tax=Streptomyces sp. NPDC017941 TaxID=3365018 RepID=UPI0037A44FEB